MSDFSEAQLWQSLQEFACSERTPVRSWVVAFSGGLDSHVLLFALTQIRRQHPSLNLAAIHVNHGVSASAQYWQEYCAQRCQALGVPLRVLKVQQPLQGASQENALRKARYELFGQSLDKSDVLLLAHHLDDQAETALLRLLRGAGPKGNAGMPASRNLGKARLLRPLTAFTRDQLHEYAVRHQLAWVEDESNQDVKHDRNYLRHELLPRIAQRWPGYRQVLARHQRISEETDASLTFFYQRELAQRAKEDALCLEWLESYPKHLQKGLVRAWLVALDVPAPSFLQTEQIFNELVTAAPDAQPLVRWPGAWVRRYQGALYAGKPEEPFDQQACYRWLAQQPLNIPGVGVLTLVPGAGNLSPRLLDVEIDVRFRRGSERCRLPGRQHSHCLKKLLQEHQVPPWQRDRIPLLFVERELAVVGTHFGCANFIAQAGERGYGLVLTQP